MKKSDLGLAIVRIIVGVIFLVHGLDKFQGGIGNTVAYFEGLGIPGIMAHVVAFIELFGGISLILGLGTRFAVMILIPVMLGAIYFVHFPEGLVRSAAGPGYGLNLILIAACIQIGLTGSSYLAVDQL